MSVSRSYALVAAKRNKERFQQAESVVDAHTQWVLSHLSPADRALVKSVTGEDITRDTTSASIFAMTLAESRMAKAVSVPMPVIDSIVRASASARESRRDVAQYNSVKQTPANSYRLGTLIDVEF